MSEEILKIGVRELARIRICYPNGEIAEMPLSNVETHCARAVQHDMMNKMTCGLLVDLAKSLADVAREHFPVNIEFVMPVPSEE